MNMNINSSTKITLSNASNVKKLQIPKNTLNSSVKDIINKCNNTVLSSMSKKEKFIKLGK